LQNLIENFISGRILQPSAMDNSCNDVDDIEDIVKIGDLMPNDRYNNKKDVLLRVRKKKNEPKEKADEIEQNGIHQSVRR
jgi:hypothetical protein